MKKKIQNNNTNINNNNKYFKTQHNKHTLHYTIQFTIKLYIL